MKNGCSCYETMDVKVEADSGADAIWCNRCNSNFNLEDIRISAKLKIALATWSGTYGAWIDWKNDGIFPGGVELEAQHNREGLTLTKKVQQELPPNDKVTFSPSTFARKMVNGEFN